MRTMSWIWLARSLCFTDADFIIPSLLFFFALFARAIIAFKCLILVAPSFVFSAVRLQPAFAIVMHSPNHRLLQLHQSIWRDTLFTRHRHNHNKRTVTQRNHRDRPQINSIRMKLIHRSNRPILPTQSPTHSSSYPIQQIIAYKYSLAHSETDNVWFLHCLILPIFTLLTFPSISSLLIPSPLIDVFIHPPFHTIE